MKKPSYREQFAAALQDFGKNQDPVAQKYEEELMRPSQVNEYAPAVRLVDTFTGSNLSAGLPKEESMKDRLSQLLQLRQGQEGQKLKGLQALAGMEESAQDKAMQRAFQEKMYGLQLAKASAKMAQKPKLGSEDKQKLGYTTTLLKELPKLRALYEQGGGSIRPGVAQMFGQNEYEVIANALAENYGRLQSGGAINKDEEARFLQRLGSYMDSGDIKLSKLKQIEEEITDKHGLYGGGSLGDSGRGPSTGSSDDEMAIQWAMQNPNTPQAAEIFSMHGKR